MGTAVTGASSARGVVCARSVRPACWCPVNNTRSTQLRARSLCDHGACRKHNDARAQSFLRRPQPRLLRGVPGGGAGETGGYPSQAHERSEPLARQSPKLPEEKGEQRMEKIELTHEHTLEMSNVKSF